MAEAPQLPTGAAGVGYGAPPPLAANVQAVAAGGVVGLEPPHGARDAVAQRGRAGQAFGRQMLHQAEEEGQVVLFAEVA